jgi:starch-binding outer membrane protein, SusD/RagB family
MMKKIKFIILALTGIVIINSCSDAEFDLKNPLVEPVADVKDLLKKESDISGMVTKCYTNIRSVALYGRLIPYMMDNMAQEMGRNPQEEPDKYTFKDFTFGAGNAQISEYWRSCYGGIKKCNFVIENEETIKSLNDPSFSQSRRDRYIAEARYMRALYYFMLVNRFGDIPLVDKTPISSTDTKPKSPKAVIVKFILDDLKIATKTLLDKSGEAKGRANKGAANALMGKVLLYQKDYTNALVAFNLVTGYSLTTDYYDNFKEETEFGPESIFEINYDMSLGTGGAWSNNVDGDGNGTANNTFRGQDYGHLAWFNTWPSDDLANEFESGDKRIAGTMYLPGDKYLNDTRTIALQDFKGLSVRAWKKYQNYYKRESENNESGINMKYMRYADVLLMKAECENEVGSQATAVGYINEVRARAGVPALSPLLSKEDVFIAIIHERKVELGGEQVRFDDIVRWRNADTQLKGSAFSEKNYLWPIPTSEFGTNSNLSSSDQNPGY